VRLAGSCADPRKVHVLHVDPQSGALRAIDVVRDGNRRAKWTIEGTVQVGPLTLPGKFVNKGPVGTEVAYVDAAWNPKLPDGVEESKEMLLGAK
jgi:hypothetical protein